MAEPATIARLRGLEAHLRTRIVEQDHVLSRVAGVFSRGELGVADPALPRGSLLLAGPTGTGKSETFITAVDYAFGPGHLVTFDMSEYQDRTAVLKFLGEDRNDPGLLGRALLAHPHGALFFDEMEKAHAPLLSVFLQMLWDGRITVATGQTFSLSSYYLGFGTNLGGAEAMRMERSKFSSVEQTVLGRLRSSLAPEFLGRIDEIMVFQRLSPDAQRRICALMVQRETERLKSLGYDLAVSREALEFLVQEGFHPQHGARRLRKTVERQLQDAVVQSLCAAGNACGWVGVDTQGPRLVIHRS